MFAARTIRPKARVARSALLLITAVAAALSPISMRAAAATGPEISAHSVQHCVVVVGKAASPNGISPELYHYCSSVSRNDARAHLLASHLKTPTGTFVPDSSDLLMTWFEDAGFGGDSTDVFGGSGTCDSAGYRLLPDSFWAHNISSAAGFGQCNHADFTNIALNFADGFVLPVSFIGQTLNDNVGIIHVFNN